MYKSVFRLLIIGVLFNLTFASNNVNYSFNQNSEGVINFSLSEYFINSIDVNGEHCEIIKVGDLPLLEIKGVPALPYKTFSIALDYSGDYKIEIDMELAVEKNIGKIAPSKGRIYRKIDPSTVKYTFNSDIYRKNSFYPAKAVEIKDTYMLREQRGATLQINPIQYNPVKGTVKIIKKLQFRVLPLNLNSPRTEVKKSSAIYNKVMSNHFINFRNENRYTPVEENDKMIIITASKYKEAAEKLAFWKNRSGIKTEVYEYPTDFNGTGDQAVKALIQEKYDNDRIAFILIIGDYGDVPSPSYTQQEYSLTTGADPIYTYLSGNDKKPDAFIGRFSVETEEQAMTVVNKNLNYECNPKNMGTEDTDWFTSCMGIASSEGTPTDKQWLNGFKDTLFSYNYNTYDSAYDPSATSTMITNAVNKGKGWINYMGHGDFELWLTGNFENSHVNALTNVGKLPIIISVACVNGEFKDRTCFAEAWQRLGSPTESKGSIIFLGASVYQDWTSPQTSNQEMMHLLKKETYSTIGAVINNGQLKMLEQDNNQETFETWHIFGDPSLKMITDEPTEISVNHKKSVTLGNQNIEVSVLGTDDANICLYSPKQNIQVVQRGTRKSIPVDVVSNDTIYVTVTARNRVPYQGYILPGSTPITSAKKLLNSSMKMNHNKKILNVLTVDNKKSTVSIFNISGRLIKEYTVTGVNKWHGLALPKNSGMFIVSIKSGGKSIINQIINTTK